MQRRIIGMFDSGLGGLTALQELRRLCPSENIIYFGDTGRMPYGAKTPEQLHTIVRQNLDFLKELGAEKIIIACGTASVNAGEIIAEYDLPVVGVVEPAVEAMAAVEGDRPLCIAATAASIYSGVYERSLREKGITRELVSVGCPDFVTLIESGHTSARDPLVIAAVEKYLREAKEKKAAAVLLGCTHYGIIREAIENYLGPETAIISASECVAKSVARELAPAEERGIGGVTYYTSGSPELFAELSGSIFGIDAGNVIAVPAQEY